MSLFDRRFVFKGQIVLRSALHVGGGTGTLSPSDSPIVRTPEGRPFVPGSSFKGAFRGTVEKIAGAIPTIRTCALVEGNSCPGTRGSEQDLMNQRRRDEQWDERRLVDELAATLCDTCKLFGSPFAASKLRFGDLYLTAGEDPVTQIRDGVGIDRDSERAVDQVKFDFEVVEATTTFDAELILDNPIGTDLGLTCLGLAEYLAGFGGLGGKRSRGLGGCQLINLRVYELDLTDEATRAQRLRDYLLGRGHTDRPLATLSTPDRMASVEDVDGFLRRHVDALIEERSG